MNEKQFEGLQSGFGAVDSRASTGLKSDLMFHRLKTRREFFDFIFSEIKLRQPILIKKFVSLMQYKAGTSATTVYDALEVLSDIGKIEIFEYKNGPENYERALRVLEEE